MSETAESFEAFENRLNDDSWLVVGMSAAGRAANRIQAGAEYAAANLEMVSTLARTEFNPLVRRRLAAGLNWRQPLHLARADAVAGMQVMCSLGHHVCDVVRTPELGEINKWATVFGNWQQPEPDAGTMMPICCAKCGSVAITAP